MDPVADVPGVMPNKPNRPQPEKPTFGPGHIDVDLGHGQSVPACRVMEFESSDAMNSFFEQNRNFLATRIFTRRRAFNEGEVLCVLISQRYTEEQYDDMILVQQVMDEQLAKLRASREEQKEKDAEAAVAQERDEKELKELGKRCREHHANVIDENAKLKKELKKLRNK